MNRMSDCAVKMHWGVRVPRQNAMEKTMEKTR